MACSPSLIPVIAEAKRLRNPPVSRHRARIRSRIAAPCRRYTTRKAMSVVIAARSSQPPLRASLTQFISAPASDNRPGNTSNARHARAAAAAKSHSRSRKKIPNMLATGRRSLRASSSGRTGSPARPRHKDRGKTHQRPGVGVGEIRGTEVSAEPLPANRTDRVTAVDSNQAKQKKADIGLADAEDKLLPREVRQVNLVAGLIGERHQCRQNQQSNKNPSKSASHSHASVTVGTSECQEMTRVRVLNAVDSLMMN